jgi:uncharacterized protein
LKTRVKFGALVALLLATLQFEVASAEFPAYAGPVTDEANILSTSVERELVSVLENHELQTSNQVVVATVKSLDGRDISEYGVELGRHWQIGQEGRDNGVILLVAPNDRKVRIEVGYGLEGALPDAIAANIIHRVILPRFREGSFKSGIREGVAAILDAIKGEYEPQTTVRKRSRGHFGYFVLLPLFLIFFPSMLFRMFRRGRRGTGGLGTAMLVGGLMASQMHRGGGAGGFGGGGLGGFTGGGGSFGGGGASGGW